mmetsp:Transcript_15603/g.22400  ORF Transcript_15603/g.22400 Transcript_15603/m.22400 type:complete len:94 (-) Transcript_15603:323-604(-)
MKGFFRKGNYQCCSILKYEFLECASEKLCSSLLQIPIILPWREPNQFEASSECERLYEVLYSTPFYFLLIPPLYCLILLISQTKLVLAKIYFA